MLPPIWTKPYPRRGTEDYGDGFRQFFLQKYGFTRFVDEIAGLEATVE